jgi:hypothetical protein
LEGYIAGGIVVMAALYALWRLERDWIERERQTQAEE